MKTLEANLNRAIYWCIKPSIESESYDNPSVRRPWRGVLTSANRLSYISRDGVVDSDSYVTAIVDDKDLFETEEAATGAFISARKWEIHRLLNLIAEKLADMY